MGVLPKSLEILILAIKPCLLFSLLLIEGVVDETSELWFLFISVWRGDKELSRSFASPSIILFAAW
jgi:hypothetical protein